MNRWITLMASAVICWAGAMACTGGSGMPGTETPPGPGPDPGGNPPVPKSLFIPVTSGDETQVYRVNIVPVEVTFSTESKLTKISPKVKFRGYQAKGSVAAHLKHAYKDNSVVGVSPYNELVVVCNINGNVVGVVACKDYQVRLMGKDAAVDILKNRKLVGFFGPQYDDVGDRLLFVVAGEGGVNHLIQRGMDGKETELYQDKDLTMMPGMNRVVYLSGGKGVFVFKIADGKLTKLSDAIATIYGTEVIGRNGDYILFLKTDKSQLVKSDASKTYDLPTYAKAKLLRLDLSELVFTASAAETTSSAKSTPASKKSLYRLDLKTGTVTTLLKTSEIGWVIDHVGDQYLVGTHKQPDALQYMVQFSWLKPDGSLQDIGSVSIGKTGKIVSYSAQHQVVAVQDGDLRLNLFSVKDGKVTATLDNTVVRPTLLFPTESEAPVLLTFQKTDAPGAFNVGLISPDTLGGTTGTDFGLVSLGTIDTKQPGATIASLILNTDIHDAKTRTPAAVADTTEPCKPKCTAALGAQPDGCGGICPVVDPCVPKCDGVVCGDDGCGGKCGVCGDPCIPKCADKKCGDDSCGGSCGTCGDGKSCSDAGQCAAKAPVITTTSLIYNNAVVKEGWTDLPILDLQVNTPKIFSGFTVAAPKDATLTSVKAACFVGGYTISATPEFKKGESVYTFSLAVTANEATPKKDGNYVLNAPCAILVEDSLGQHKQINLTVHVAP